ncbi:MULTISPECIES: UDP-glucose dehydrogenase family protein [Pseudanabaena]|jgi:UDPglucose 6-dehydrogenase|uniref:UDP-glucose dehydrogenase family protein n=1 Tax=Pseudanabaena TaxID=1152 RepID=UPI002478CD02|nr:MULTISPECIES: UDP-glucose/GDP-mannose dehydrogenase family protein [Pseudanabaena]MEA5488388.1 UDP-glucose/GDP-mannose dehydrogenase family protein [Pseudanabaena sp. CCNP1317]WGS70406.1 UDP-glucose/GDP-mannose dehydrogenase family protein [Pseudanabaena galeata CCNP1313]
MRVCVIGTGYVGLVTGACLAYIGHDVICVDNNEEKVKLMKSGQSPIHEPGLPEVIAESIRQGKIEFTTDIAAGVQHGEILFIAVGTPSLADGRSDMRYVEAVARSIGESLTEGYRVIVNKSTVPIGSGDWVRMIVMDGMSGKSNIDQIQFDVVSNPEFLREGVAVFDTFNPDRIVVGSGSDRALKLMQELYQPIIDRSFAEDKTLPPVPVVVTDLNSAEMIKYAANAFLATKISFVNEVANICDRVGADVKEVAKGIGLDSRIGSKFLQAGIGWGGSCFGKDVSALIYTAEDYGYSTEILKACVRVNELQRTLVVEKLQQALKILKGKTIGLLGMTFKPDTDDMRDAPALTLIDQLSRLGARVKAYDPLVSQSGLRQGFSNVIVETDLERLADGCDAVVLVTDWQEFLAIDYAKMLTLMAHPVIIDARNFLDGKELKALGYHYIGIGR